MRAFATRFADAVDRLNGYIGSLSRWLIILMVGIGAYNAVARWATRQLGVGLSSNALNELQWYLFSVVFLLGAAYCLKEDVHVRVDVLYERLSPKARGWIDLLGSVLFLLPFSVLMIHVSIPAVRNSWRILETSADPGGLPRYPLKTLLIVAFALLFLQGLAQIVRAIEQIRGGAEQRDDAEHPGSADGPVSVEEGI
ncbi:MAG TPA: TRAP transporter small permease subunit [Longimicrobiales bacterium]|nr:TRAP transporter small permease subunit [Longimicrobiales bacterium]